MLWLQNVKNIHLDKKDDKIIGHLQDVFVFYRPGTLKTWLLNYVLPPGLFLS